MLGYQLGYSPAFDYSSQHAEVAARRADVLQPSHLRVQVPQNGELGFGDALSGGGEQAEPLRPW